MKTKRHSREGGLSPFAPAWVERLHGQLAEGQVISVPSLPDSASAALASALCVQHDGPVICLTDRPQSLERLVRDLCALTGWEDERIPILPEREGGSAAGDQRYAEMVADRMGFLRAGSDRPLRVACVQGLLQPMASLADLEASTLRLKTGDLLTEERMVAFLERGGYRFELEVLERGQACIRGGLLDCWPPSEEWPLRIERFGDEVDSIRSFDPAAQSSRERLTSCSLTPAVDRLGDSETVFAFEEVDPSTLWILLDPDGILGHADLFLEQGTVEPPFSALELPEHLCKRSQGGVLCVGGEIGVRAEEHGVIPVESVPSVHHGQIPVDQLEQARKALVADVLEQADSGWTVDLFFDTPGVADRFQEQYLGGEPRKGLTVRLAPLSEGFQHPDRKLAVYTEGDLYGYHREIRGRYDPLRRKGGRAATGVRLTEWSDIQPGDFVVHVDQGIGRYHGIIEIEFDGRLQEVLSIEYAEDTRLYLPVSQTHLLSRYIGSGKAKPRLHRLGGVRWTKEKAIARRAAEDLAAVLLDSQAKRDTTPGHAFAPDGHWQNEFEATFPFEETPDQMRAIDEVKADMERARPMDRLVCGDVGFGKTEVAMRAAFKAVMDGKQVAMLVPTTVLARQHYHSFRERMAAFPVTIEMLSRFRTPAEQRATLDELAEGKIDILVGTHRLVQPDVRFHDLGLVIIDEEQRFGVKHKEQLKRMKALVDVMTLSATPIPRTLYMSLTGARDLSTIQTPPRQRQPVETVVARYEDNLIREVILREMNRGGQIYFLHNRVKTIRKMAEKLQKLIPQVRITVGHGQMARGELELALETFIEGDVDLLLCTTIIESGVDIPNVNTIIIDRADRFGVADLYQLKGRVGRFKRKAFAYLLLPEGRGSAYTARKRVQAIQKYSSLGAGFKVAMQDLELRGAGNILGAQQSGHIAAVGFELYCQFLKRTVAKLKGEAVPRVVDAEIKLDFLHLTPSRGDEERRAGIPYEFIEDENQRLHLFRRIASLMERSEVDALQEELRDRFGPLPLSVKRLIQIARIRIIAAEKNIRSIEVQEGKVKIFRGRDYIKTGSRFPGLTSEDPDQRLAELEAMVEKGFPEGAASA